MFKLSHLHKFFVMEIALGTKAPEVVIPTGTKVHVYTVCNNAYLEYLLELVQPVRPPSSASP